MLLDEFAELVLVVESGVDDARVDGVVEAFVLDVRPHVRLERGQVIAHVRAQRAHVLLVAVVLEAERLRQLARA